ncbi:type VII secretion system-associated protein [Streptomyces griseoviridis]|uniref:type VII secretion system-associated protein n=1 Tax=Streptomyces griseoviridis TaxID=45398 RepID=UPI0026D9E9C3
MSDNGALAAVHPTETDEPSDDTTETGPTGADDGMPRPPREFVEAARLAPEHWLYLTDPAWQGEGAPPDWAVVGQWRSDADGEIVEWQDNENYQPSPEALGWPEPADDVDAAIQLATTGYGPAEDVAAALVRAEVAVLVTASGEPVSASAPDGTPVVPIFTSPPYLHAAGRLGFERVRVPALLARLPEGHSLSINSSAPISMVMTTDGLADLTAAAAELDGEPERDGPFDWSEGPEGPEGPERAEGNERPERAEGSQRLERLGTSDPAGASDPADLSDPSGASDPSGVSR